MTSTQKYEIALRLFCVRAIVASELGDARKRQREIADVDHEGIVSIDADLKALDAAEALTKQLNAAFNGLDEAIHVFGRDGVDESIDSIMQHLREAA